MEERISYQKVRCFVAIDFPRNVISEVERVQGELKKKMSWNGKLVDGENLHLTLKFLGEIALAEVDKIKDKLKKIKMKGFVCKLGGLGVFGSHYIRIVWVKILGKGIFELQKRVDRVLSLDFEGEERFMSHLTIARVKNIKDRKLFLEKMKEVKVSGFCFDVNEFYLMKSVLKLEGAEYEILEKFVLE